jgi:RND family efflux transporter MFP subunit
MVRISEELGDGLHPVRPGDQLASGLGINPDQELWRQFAEATTPKTFCQSWLSLLCQSLQGIKSGLVLLGNTDRGPFTPAAVWPHPYFSVKHLTAAAERTLKERRGLFIPNDSAENPETREAMSYSVTYPIEASGKLYGAVVLEVELRPGHEIQSMMRQLHWGAAWLEVMHHRTAALKSEGTIGRLQTVLNLIASAVEEGHFQPAAMAFVTKLATELDCDRVSLGFIVGQQLRVQALSHSAEFGKQMNLVRAIEAAMEEAVDQQAVVAWPSPPDTPPLVTLAHAELARQHGVGSICTVPLGNKGKFVGGLTLERPEEKPFDPDTVEVIETLAALVGPILETKRREERWLITKAGESLANQLKKLVGAGHLAVKLSAAVLLALVIFFWLAKGDYRISAKTGLEGTIQRMVSAPFNGYITEARVRPGDVVKQGELLCLLDDRDLKLERLRYFTQKEQLVKQYHEAMAKHDRPQIHINKSKIDQAEAQIALLDEQLLRTKVVAPFNGVIMKGDLSQSLGAPVERGQVLFEVAPLESYRVIIEVDERDIADVVIGQGGELVLPSMPGDVFPLVVDKITPVSIAKEGRNYFRVEAHLENVSERLRPGMEGVGKITVDRRKLIWIWTHELIDWLRLKLWSWWP